MACKQELSLAICLKFLAKLKLSDADRLQFVDSVVDEKRKRISIFLAAANSESRLVSLFLPDLIKSVLAGNEIKTKLTVDLGEAGMIRLDLIATQLRDELDHPIVAGTVLFHESDDD